MSWEPLANPDCQSVGDTPYASMHEEQYLKLHSVTNWTQLYSINGHTGTVENHRAVSYSKRGVIRRKNAPNVRCFFRKEFLGLPDDVKAAECFTTYFPNVRVH